MAQNPSNNGGPTGPRTPEGKAVSSQNARKHGYRSQNLLIPEDLKPEFDSLFDGLLRDIQPQGELENRLFTKLVRNMWFCERIEFQLFQLAQDGLELFFGPVPAEKRAELELLERYRERFEAGTRATLRELRKVQSTRIAQLALPSPLGQGALPALVEPAQILTLAKRSDPDFARRAMDALIDHADDQLRYLYQVQPGPAIILPDTPAPAPTERT